MAKKPAPYNTGPGRRYDAISGQNRAKNRVFSLTRQKAFFNVQNARPREASGTNRARVRWKHLTKGAEPNPQAQTRARGRERVITDLVKYAPTPKWAYFAALERVFLGHIVIPGHFPWC